ncbi:MAG: type II toxin-antitoxin system HicB family antitoxin [archaeon]|nr:type II toxin-antitoxin system HicB family antitoxin [archaeon]
MKKGIFLLTTTDIFIMEKEYSAVITKGETAFVAFCPELGVTTQGKTEKAALKNLKEALELYLEDEDVQKMLKARPFKRAKVATIFLNA